MKIDLATRVLVHLGVLIGPLKVQDDTKCSRTLHTDYGWPVTKNYW